MINGVQTTFDNGFKVDVHTTSNRGWTPEELADRALEKLLHVSKDADEQVKAQALVFKEQIRQVLVFYMKEAIKSDRTTICAELQKQGHAELAKSVNFRRGPLWLLLKQCVRASKWSFLTVYTPLEQLLPAQEPLRIACTLRCTPALHLWMLQLLRTV
jgi:hypothetical protein